MKYRKLDNDGDYVIGKNENGFFRDSPDAVAQAIKTRLGLMKGEWMLDTSAGVPYKTDVLGFGNLNRYDFVIQEVIFNTEGVKEIISYNSFYNQYTRKVTISAEVSTIFGKITVSEAL